MKKTLKTSALNITKQVVSGMVKNDANSASCIVLYQPKAPAALKKFSKLDK